MLSFTHRLSAGNKFEHFSKQSVPRYVPPRTTTKCKRASPHINSTEHKQIVNLTARAISQYVSSIWYNIFTFLKLSWKYSLSQKTYSFTIISSQCLKNNLRFHPSNTDSSKMPASTFHVPSQNLRRKQRKREKLPPCSAEAKVQDPPQDLCNITALLPTWLT